MSHVGLLHLCLAGSAALMAVLHVALWLNVPKERAQLWVALSQLSLGAVLLSNWSFHSEGLDARTWRVMSVPTSLLHPAMLLVLWNLLDVRITGVRRWLLIGVCAVATAMAVERGLSVADTHRTVQGWSSLYFGGPWAPLSLLGLYAPLAAWGVEAALHLRRRPEIAVPTFVCSCAAAASTAALFAVGLGDWFGLGGVAFLVFASTMVVVGYVRSARRVEWAGEYRLVELLASGGMGDLYLAEKHGPVGFVRQVALKRIRTIAANRSSGDWEQRFFSEARLAASLSHPNLITVQDFGRLPGEGWFLAMEYLRGASLTQIRACLSARGEAIPTAVLLAIGEQASRGLASAHRAGIVHRDVSGANIMVTYDGVTKLLDFGIAKRSGEPAVAAASEALDASTPIPTDLTNAGLLLGKPGYLSPERFEGRAATPASDVFAMGVVLFELATLTLPYRPPDLPQAAARREAWVPPRALRPDLPEPLDAAITRALAWEADQRFASAAELAVALRVAAEGLSWVDLGAWLEELIPPVRAEVPTSPAPTEAATVPVATPEGTHATVTIADARDTALSARAGHR